MIFYELKETVKNKKSLFGYILEIRLYSGNYETKQMEKI